MLHSGVQSTGLLIGRGRKSQILGTNWWKNRPIARGISGSFLGKFHQKAIGKNGRFCGYFQGKFR